MSNQQGELSMGQVPGPFLEHGEEALTELVSRVSYKDGWKFRVTNNRFYVTMPVIDSVTGARNMLTHMRPVPPHFIDAKYMRRWVLNVIFDIERHEAMEFFLIDGAAPFFPEHHGDPYVVREREVPFPISRRAPVEIAPLDRWSEVPQRLDNNPYGDTYRYNGYR